VCGVFGCVWFLVGVCGVCGVCLWCVCGVFGWCVWVCVDVCVMWVCGVGVWCVGVCGFVCGYVCVALCGCVCVCSFVWLFFCYLFSMPHYKVILHALVSNVYNTVTSTLMYIPSFSTVIARSEPDSTRRRTGGEVNGKDGNGVGSQHPPTGRRNTVYTIAVR